MANDLLSTYFKDLRISTKVSTDELMGRNKFCILLSQYILNYYSPGSGSVKVYIQL